MKLVRLTLDAEKLEKMQKITTKIIQELEKMFYRERDLNKNGLFIWVKGRLKTGLITVCKYLQRKKVLRTKWLFKLAGHNFSWTNNWELKPDSFKLKIRHQFFYSLLQGKIVSVGIRTRGLPPRWAQCSSYWCLWTLGEQQLNWKDTEMRTRKE